MDDFKYGSGFQTARAYGHAELKRAKEAFVTGHSGTSMFEVSLVVTVVPIAIMFHRVLASTLCGSRALRNVALRAAFEFAVIVFPTIICFTYTQCVPWIIGGMLACIMVLGYGTGRVTMNANNLPVAQSTALLRRMMQSRIPFLNYFRSGMMLCTCIAILAVDFVIFPRRFVKCETYGTSLMDVGVGAFVFSSGVVSRQARNVGASDSAWTRFARTVRSASPMLVLGIIRIAVNAGADYQTHVSEYGVHWNFFFSLAGVALMSALLEAVLSTGAPDRLKSRGYSVKAAFALIGIGLGIAAGYQVALSRLGLRDFVLHAPRVDLLSANREGVFGILGFLGIYMLGAGTGRLMARRYTHLSDWTTLLKLLLTLAAVAWMATAASHTFIEPVSRRMTNLSYVFWIWAYNLTQICLLLAVELAWSYTKPVPESIIYTGINENGLAIFLIANLLTGAVNLSMPTIFAPPLVGLAVVTAYMAAVVTIGTALSAYSVSLKFW